MDSSYAIALVYAWAMENPEYYSSWVNPYKAIKYGGYIDGKPHMQSVSVGGHYRKRIGYRMFPTNLLLTCKFDTELGKQRYMTPPLACYQERWDEDGFFIPKRHRQTVVA